jgi:AraC-like DNA-binding protein
LEYLHARPTSNVSLAQLEAVAGLSRYHLVRQFSREFGLPPHAYHLQLRIDEARRLLAAGTPATRVASATGFYDQSHFGRHFLRLVGVTPPRYRPAST